MLEMNMKTFLIGKLQCSAQGPKSVSSSRQERVKGFLSASQGLSLGAGEPALLPGLLWMSSFFPSALSPPFPPIVGTGEQAQIPLSFLTLEELSLLPPLPGRGGGTTASTQTQFLSTEQVCRLRPPLSLLLLECRRLLAPFIHLPVSHTF